MQDKLPLTSVISFMLCTILLLLSLTIMKSLKSELIINHDDIYYSFFIDNNPSNQAPTINGGYAFEHADCTNGASVTWDDTIWGAKIDNLTTARTKCTLYFVKESDNAAKTITALVNGADPSLTSLIDNGISYDTDGVTSLCTNTMAYDDYRNLRFVGANPCNYVTFNGEDSGWRIIGVFGNNVKLIKKDSVGEYSWDSSASNANSGYGINEWGGNTSYNGADMMRLLNPGYETSLAEGSSGNTISGTYANNSLYWTKSSGNCYSNRKNAYTACNFTANGLATDKDMIDTLTWYTGSNDVTTYTTDNIKAREFYELERSSNTGKKCTSGTYCNDTVSRGTTWEGQVGLMSPSDYGYAVGGSARDNCLANTNLSAYNTNNCSSNNWLTSTNDQWTINPAAKSTDARYVFYLDSRGLISSAITNQRYQIRPVVYLKQKVQIIEGTGTPKNPFILELH